MQTDKAYIRVPAALFENPKYAEVPIKARHLYIELLHAAKEEALPDADEENIVFLTPARIKTLLRPNITPARVYAYIHALADCGLLRWRKGAGERMSIVTLLEPDEA